MIRTVAKASSSFRRLAASASNARHALLNPAISPAIATVPCRHNLCSHVGQSPFIPFPAIQGQFRGYAPGRGESDRRVPEDDDGFSDGDVDSEDFDTGGEDFSEDNEEGLIDEDSADEDEVEDESD